MQTDLLQIFLICKITLFRPSGSGCVKHTMAPKVAEVQKTGLRKAFGSKRNGMKELKVLDLCRKPSTGKLDVTAEV